MTSIYEDGTYLANNPEWHQEDSPWKANRIVDMMKRNALDPRTVCEVGCGAGEILNQLSSFYTDKQFVGYEVSPQAFDLCRGKDRSNLLFKFADLLNDDSAHFDVALAIDVFEHIEDYFSFLRGLRDKADFKIFHIPLDLSVQAVLRASPIVNVRRAVGHINYFTKETALETLSDTGYSIIDYFYTAGALELSNRGWKADLLRIPRMVAFHLHKDLAVRVLGGFSLMVLAK